MVGLVVSKNVEKYERIYRDGYNKKYPNLDLVRLEAWYFGHKPGRVLDFGCGTGVNTIHLLECGHEVVGVDAAGEAVEIVRARLHERPDFAGRGATRWIGPDDERLDFADRSFDYVICMSVLSLLETRDRIARLVGEFRRILKPGGKMIVDVNGPGSDFAEKGKFIGNDVFEYTLRPEYAAPIRCYCPRSVNDFAKLFSDFVIDDLGHSSFRYAGQDSFEFIACVHVPE